VIAVDVDCCIHCLDAGTGEHYWSCDTFAPIWASPLIVDETVFVLDEDGDVSVFPLSKDPRQSVTSPEGDERPKTEFYSEMGDGWGDSDLIFANGVLYVTGNYRLYAIQAPQK
jgi:outer membrane protein assembly factor BamB